MSLFMEGLSQANRAFLNAHFVQMTAGQAYVTDPGCLDSLSRALSDEGPVSEAALNLAEAQQRLFMEQMREKGAQVIPLSLDQVFPSASLWKARYQQRVGGMEGQAWRVTFMPWTYQTVAAEMKEELFPLSRLGLLLGRLLGSRAPFFEREIPDNEPDNKKGEFVTWVELPIRLQILAGFLVYPSEAASIQWTSDLSTTREVQNRLKVHDAWDLCLWPGQGKGGKKEVPAHSARWSPLGVLRHDIFHYLVLSASGRAKRKEAAATFECLEEVVGPVTEGSLQNILSAATVIHSGIYVFYEPTLWQSVLGVDSETLGYRHYMKDIYRALGDHDSARDLDRRIQARFRGHPYFPKASRRELSRAYLFWG